MKEAAGEANLTVIAIILIGVIAAIMTPVINSYMTTAAKKGCCTNYGGYWEAGKCKIKTSEGVVSDVSVESYWANDKKSCAADQ